MLCLLQLAVSTPNGSQCIRSAPPIPGITDADGSCTCAAGYGLLADGSCAICSPGYHKPAPGDVPCGSCYRGANCTAAGSSAPLHGDAAQFSHFH